MIKIGDKVLLVSTGTLAKVSKIVSERGDGTEAKLPIETAATRLNLESEYGTCKVYMHDENVSWFNFNQLN